MGGCVFLETCVLLGCPVCWHITVHSILLWFFVFLWYQLFLLFDFLFCLSGFFLFSSRWVWLEACWFYLFRRPALVSLIFSVVFGSLFCLFPLWFYYFLHFDDSGFCLFFFPNSFMCQVSLFEIFLVSWGKPVWLWTSLL